MGEEQDLLLHATRRQDSSAQLLICKIHDEGIVHVLHAPLFAIDEFAERALWDAVEVELALAPSEDHHSRSWSLLGDVHDVVEKALYFLNLQLIVTVEIIEELGHIESLRKVPAVGLQMRSAKKHVGDQHGAFFVRELHLFEEHRQIVTKF